MKKKLCIGVVIAMLLSMTMGCGSTKEKENPIKVGMELAYPPFETKDNDGNPIGVSVDFAKAIGEYLGRPVKIENIAWDGLIPALQTGQVDMVISSMTITSSRQEKIDFSKPYAKALLAVLTNKNSDIKKIEDLNKTNKKIAVKNGSTGYMYAKNNLKNAELIVLADESACVTEVSQGKADGFIYDQLTIYRNQQKNMDTTAAIYIPFQDVEYWGVGIKKDNKELLDKVNEFIDKFYEKDGFQPITDKYLSKEKADFDKLGFQWFFSDMKKK